MQAAGVKPLVRSPVISLFSVTRRFGHSTALARSTCLSFGMANLSVSKYFGSGQNRMVVPVLDFAHLADHLELRLELCRPRS